MPVAITGSPAAATASYRKLYPVLLPENGRGTSESHAGGRADLPRLTLKQ
jgi:hypothetical protein